MSNWKSEDIEAILLQLDRQCLPFQKYSLVSDTGEIVLLGKGATADVYKARKRKTGEGDFAIKVLGFNGKSIDSRSFRETVEAQELLNINIQEKKHIVSVYASGELRVFIEGAHTVTRTEVIESADSTPPPGNYLHLQFIVMEEVLPIMGYDLLGHPQMMIPALQKGDEQEILKLAKDIGSGLQHAHANHILHRDVKLENIFYSEKNKCYKLGDFGIAVTVQDGFASTIAYTKGYGAPEVLTIQNDRYDCTADIYSFGIVLYVLLNHLCFPNAKDYHHNESQYIEGFVPQRPCCGSDELWEMVLKMIRYSPDERYQTMEQVLTELHKIRYGERVKYQIEHQMTARVIGMFFAILGAAFWKLAFFPYAEVNFSLGMYGFLAICLWKAVKSAMHKDESTVGFLLLLWGLILTFATGITWWKILVVVIVIGTNGYMAGLFAGGMLAVKLAAAAVAAYPEFAFQFVESQWLAVTLLSLSVFLLLYAFLVETSQRIILLPAEMIALFWMYTGRNLYWIAAALFYALLLLVQYLPSNIYSELLYRLMGYFGYGYIQQWNPTLIGLSGLAFCLLWIGRETCMLSRKRKADSRNEQMQEDVQ